MPQFPTTAFEPYMKLAQSNMRLMGEYAMSPEVLSQPMWAARRFFEPGNDSVPAAPSLEAIMMLAQGLMKNFMEFGFDLAQSGTSVWMAWQRKAWQPGALPGLGEAQPAQ